MNVKINKDILILIGIAFFVWLIYFRVNFCGLLFPDAMYYASLARNIVTGDGYQANVTSTFNFTYLRTNVFTPPVNPPLFPYLLAFFFKIAGISARVSALCTSLFFIISIIPLYLLSNRLFGRLVAVITSLIFILEPTMLWYSISGLTEPIFIFFILLAFLFLSLFYEKEKTYYVILAGVCIGLCKLTRFNASVFIAVIILALFLFTKERRLRTCALFVFGVILTNIPALVSILFTKTPMLAQGLLIYCAIDGTPQYPLGTLSKMLDPMTSWEYIRTYPRDFIYKYSDNVYFYCKNFFTMINPIITALFTVSIMSFKSNKVVRMLLFILGLSILAQMALISYNIAIIRYFFIFIPFIIIFGVGFFFELFYQSNCSLSYKTFVFLLVVIVLLSTTRFHIIFIKSYRVLFQNYESKEAVMVKQQSLIGDFIRKNTKKDDFIVTDYSSIGWYADRKTLELPISFDVLETIDSEYKRVDAILLTSASDIYNMRRLSGVGERLVEWREILTNQPNILGEYVLYKQGIIRDEKFVFYKRKYYQE